jgi:hypothetical protein
MKLKINVGAAVWLAFCFAAVSQDARSQAPDWPREVNRNGSRILLYQPQVDDWKTFSDLHRGSAFLPKSPVVCAEYEANAAEKASSGVIGHDT